jgi:uncharacterized protein (TIGR02145 family)
MIGNLIPILFNKPYYRKLYDTYKARVTLDGGTVTSDNEMLSILQTLVNIGCIDNTKLLWYGGAGVKLRTSGVNKYVTRGYSSDPIIWPFISVASISNSGGKIRVVTTTPHGMLTGEYCTLFGFGALATTITKCTYVDATTFDTDVTYSAYSVTGATVQKVKDLLQTTDVSQPWQSGNIAPNEKPCLLNPNGGSRFLSHPVISFGATDAWSISVMLNSNSVLTGSSNDFAGKYGTTRLGFLQNGNKIVFQNESSSAPVEVISNLSLHGKNKLLTFVAQGTGTLLVYIDAVYAGILTVATNAVFERLLSGRWLYFFGKIHYYRIQSGAMTASQITAEYNTLRGIVPEREFVIIGSQAWTTSNLDIVCDAAGVVIPEVTDNTAWAALTTAAWCHYNNDSANGAIYGKLYNWYAVKQIDDALAAVGSEWRVPTQTQLNTLATTLGGASVAGGKMKVTGTSYWATPNTGATNESGFSALGSGSRNDVDGSFGGLTNWFLSWSNTESTTNAYRMYLSNSSANLSISIDSKKMGRCIRLVKNL